MGPAKNRTNIAKHGVDFADAVALSEDELALTCPDTGARGESRFVTLGQDSVGRLLIKRVHAARFAYSHNFSTLCHKQERKSYEA